MRRATIDASGGRPTTTAEFETALGIIHRSAVLAVLSCHIDTEVGRPRTLSLLGLLVGAQLNGMRRHHRRHLVEIARVLNALSHDQRNRLDLRQWEPDETYYRVERLFLRLCSVLDAGLAAEVKGTSVRIDGGWFANCIATAAIPAGARTSASVAVDGTDLETWGALHGDTATLDLDGAAPETELTGTQLAPSDGKRPKTGRRAKVLGLGADGRKIYTADPDARAGHRSATNSRPAGPYVGYELHLAVQTRDVRWTNYIDKTTLGTHVASVVTTFNLVPAGSHRASSVVPSLLRAKDAGQGLEDVVWDPGYSLCRPETGYWPLAHDGIHTTFQPVTHQRGQRPSPNGTVLIDGTLFSDLLPDELRDLSMPPWGASEAEKRAYEAAYNRRARWRYVRHAGPDRDGATRWRCPFCAGLLRSRSLPRTMRRSRSAPLVQAAADHCCSGTLTVQPAELPLWQRLLPGTTAWRISMGRRQMVESVNAALKGGFVNLTRGFFRVMGQTKATVLLGFTLAGFNLDRVRAFVTGSGLAGSLDELRQRSSSGGRSTRRRGTWEELLSPGQRDRASPN